MDKLQTDGRQHQSCDSQVFSKKPILMAVSVTAVTDDRMRERIEVPANLVIAAGLRVDFQQ